MKERLINNLGLKILSIFLAFFIWLVVVNVSNPEVTRSKEIQIEIENEQVLAAANKTYEISDKNTVTVTYVVRTRDEYKIRANDFRAYIDLAELYAVTGSVPVKVEVLNNKEIISNAAAKPGSIRVETEDMQRKSFELKRIVIGEPEEGYEISNFSLSPEFVYVNGPVSLVRQISYVGIEVEATGLNEDKSGTVTPIFYDANDNKLSLGDRVVIEQPEIAYQMTIHKVKKLNLDFEVTGAVADGYQYAGVESSKKVVSVQGLKTTLASLNKITIPGTELNIDGAVQDKVVVVDLSKYVPEGVTIVGDKEVEIRLKVEKLETRTFVLSDNDIHKTGGKPEYHYQIDPHVVEVVIQGLAEDLEGLNVADIRASMTLQQYEQGAHKGVLTFERNNNFNVISYSDFQVVVTEKGIGPTVAETSEETTKALEPGNLIGTESEEPSAEESSVQEPVSEESSSELSSQSSTAVAEESTGADQ